MQMGMQMNKHVVPSTLCNICFRFSFITAKVNHFSSNQIKQMEKVMKKQIPLDLAMKSFPFKSKQKFYGCE